MSSAVWVGTCTGCARADIDVASRRSHGERVLCNKCAEKPYRFPSATGLGSRDEMRDRVNGTSSNGNGAKPQGLHITRASDVRVRAVEFLLPGRVPVGALTLLAGDPGLGKSTWHAASPPPSAPDATAQLRPS